MNNKFGRIAKFIDNLEQNELITQDQQFLLLVGASGGSGSYGNNCGCPTLHYCDKSDNCNCP